MADDSTSQSNSGDDATQGNPGGEDSTLGPEGVKALEVWKERARNAEREAKRARELEAELARFRESTMSEQEKAEKKARDAAWAEAKKAFNTRILQAEVRAAAAGKLADPEDAIRFVDLDGFEVDESGSVDKKAVTKALDELVKAKPYLAASATRPTGDADQGTRRASGGSSMNDLIKAAITRR